MIQRVAAGAVGLLRETGGLTNRATLPIIDDLLGLRQVWEGFWATPEAWRSRGQGLVWDGRGCVCGYRTTLIRRRRICIERVRGRRKERDDMGRSKKN